MSWIRRRYVALADWRWSPWNWQDGHWGRFTTLWLVGIPYSLYAGRHESLDLWWGVVWLVVANVVAAVWGRQLRLARRARAERRPDADYGPLWRAIRESQHAAPEQIATLDQHAATFTSKAGELLDMEEPSTYLAISWTASLHDFLVEAGYSSDQARRVIQGWVAHTVHNRFPVE